MRKNRVLVVRRQRVAWLLLGGHRIVSRRLQGSQLGPAYGPGELESICPLCIGLLVVVVWLLWS